MKKNPALAVARSGASAARREHILDAGERLFGSLGFRAVTMERVAVEASVAKATLYSYFPNRDALFKAAAERLATRFTQAFIARVDTRGKVEEGIVRALIEKHGAAHELLHRSGHARELLTAKNALAGDFFLRADRKMLAALETALASDERLRESAAQLARALFYGAAGLAEQARSADDLRTMLEAFIRTHIRGARRPGARTMPRT